jgi:uncharacterized membrane protein
MAEWRTPLYLYSCVPTVALFGISPLGVRLPAAIFGILTIPLFYLLIKQIFDDEKLALIGAFVMAISPWHIQYSRAAFEVTQLLFFLVLGVYAFMKAIHGNQKYLILAGASLCITPWIYSTAKLFTPMLMVVLITLYLNKLLKFNRKILAYTIIVCLIIGLPLVYGIFFGGGSQRFSYISVFSDPTTESEVGTARLFDARARGENGDGLHPTFVDRAFHNKYFYWGSQITNSYLDAFSTNFLFINGDPNLRHSIKGMGELYAVDSIVLIVGMVYLFSAKKIERKTKALLALWILAGVIPASLTEIGGTHATRLIVILIPLLIILAYGIRRLNKVFLLAYVALLMFNFVFYQHDYWVHNPVDSARWWHYGFEDAITYIKNTDKNYDKVVLSTAGEPPWIFFAGWYEYPPREWQQNFPIGNDVDLTGFGRVSHIDKFYFGSPKTESYWQWNTVIDSKILYLADAREININLAREPERTPQGLKLLKAITYPDGEPAFYLITGSGNE